MKGAGAFQAGRWLMMTAVLSLTACDRLPWISRDHLKFDVDVQGAPEGMERELKKVASLKPGEENSPDTVIGLRARAEEGEETLTRYLRAQGYYGAVVRAEVEEAGDKPRVVFAVEAGAPYRAASRALELAEGTPEGIALPDAGSLAPENGEAVKAETLLKASDEARTRIAQRNCLLKVEVTPSLTLDPAGEAAAVHYEVNAGPYADFGSTIVTGNQAVKEEYIRRQLSWKEGECFRADAIDAARKKLIESQLFAQVEVYPDEAGPDASAKVAVHVNVTERFHRTVKAGVSYMTDEGPGATFGWEHRNFFGEGEKLEAQAVISALEYSLDGNFTRPSFLRPDQTLKLNAQIAEERPDAYTSKNTSVAASLERPLRKNLKAGAGVGYRLSHVEDVLETNNYGLISTPLFIEWDNRDDALNPTRGFQARGDAAPFFDTLGSGSYFLRSLGTARTYFRFDENGDTLLALRGTLGSITAASTRDVPADLRFYAGGGASVRGYGYQDLSPTRSGEIYGGRSLVELSAEGRFKFTDTLGGAVFLDGGNAYDNPYPDFEDPLRFGAGVGVRYYTGFGPLRLDVGVPLNKRQGDSAYQLYVSLGQAF